MNNIKISKEALIRGEQWYQGAIRAFEDERWNDVVYSYEMAVEQVLKAILILFGREYPKIHDIRKFYLNINVKDFPKWFIDKMDFHASILKELVKLRSISSYGYVDGITKDYFKEDAIKFKEDVEQIIKDCKKLIKDFSNE